MDPMDTSDKYLVIAKYLSDVDTSDTFFSYTFFSYC
jgi:hypothetical protein